MGIHIEGLSSVLSQVQKRGFACIHLEDKRYIQLITDQLMQTSDTFRFPPLEGNIGYDTQKRNTDTP